MNARSEVFELALEGRQVQEAVAVIFHTLLFHRTLGKFHYKSPEGNYLMSSIGFEDVACDFIDCTYVRCSSDSLNSAIMRDVYAFSEALRSSDGTQEGQISLEFFQKRSRWFGTENIPWEVWMVKVNIVHLPNELARQKYREQMGAELGDKVMAIATAVNRYEYVPKVPAQNDLDLIFDTRFNDVQPYLFKVAYQINAPHSPSSVSNTLRRIMETIPL